MGLAIKSSIILKKSEKSYEIQSQCFAARAARPCAKCQALTYKNFNYLFTFLFVPICICSYLGYKLFEVI